MIRFRQLNEALDFIFEAGTARFEVEPRFWAVAANDPTIESYLRIAFDPNHRLVGLPKGMPSSYKPERDLPDGVSDMTGKGIFRRVGNFREGGPMAALKEPRRIMQWVDLMESLHYKEADVIIALKDGVKAISKLYPGFPVLVEILSPDVREENELLREADVDTEEAPVPVFAPGVDDMPEDMPEEGFVWDDAEDSPKEDFPDEADIEETSAPEVPPDVEQDAPGHNVVVEEGFEPPPAAPIPAPVTPRKKRGRKPKNK